MSPAQLADLLVSLQVVKLSPRQPFTFSSGIRSPIYCDHRLLLGNVDARRRIVESWAKNMAELEVAQLAGVATAGIPWAAFLAQSLSVPMVYVRTKAKDHGTAKLIEGQLDPSLKTWVIEDLVSTGGSSLRVVETLRENGCQVAGVASIFSYNLAQAQEDFTAARVRLKSLITLNDLMVVLREQNALSVPECQSLEAWQANPQAWQV